MSCQELFSYPIQTDSDLLDENLASGRGNSPIPVLREEVEESIHSLHVAKFPGADNIPAQLLKQGVVELTTFPNGPFQKNR